MICRDLCNSLKHLVLDPKYEKSRDNPAFAQVPVHVIVANMFTDKEHVELQSTAMIETASGLVDGYELAARCASEWERYILANGGRVK